MVRGYSDVEAAVLLVRVVSMTKEGWENHDEVTMVAAICGWDEGRAGSAVEKSKVQAGLPPASDTPTDADRAEMLLLVAAHEPPGLDLERLLAFVRGWSVGRARRAFAEAARQGLLECVATS
jgi:hypothetical protein